ncbi:cytochrome c oxidase assembly factor 3 homolog, mitochondrial [Natator depressus]|uniref:cytochrome c oxidase assembly factor 3 homolog, mitochondrial n=1 Tax=Natator depressus TaxID=27790 RepID=UPI003EBDD056
MAARAPAADVTCRSVRPAGERGARLGSAGKMAAPREPGGGAQRTEPEPRRVVQRAEGALRQRALQRRLRGRNLLTGLGIGAVVLGIYGYTFYKISQERFLDELEQEVEAARAQAAKTPAN